MTTPLYQNLFDKHILEEAKNNLALGLTHLNFYEECSAFLSFYIMLSKHPGSHISFQFLPRQQHHFNFYIKEQEQINTMSSAYMGRVCDYFQEDPKSEKICFQYFSKNEEKLRFLKSISTPEVWAYFEEHTNGEINQLSELTNYDFPVLRESRVHIEDRLGNLKFQYQTHKMYCDIYEIQENLKQQNFEATEFHFCLLSSFIEEQNTLERVIVLGKEGEHRDYRLEQFISFGLSNGLLSMGLNQSHSVVLDILDSDAENQSENIFTKMSQHQELVCVKVFNVPSAWLRFDAQLLGSRYADFLALSEKLRLEKEIQSVLLVATQTAETTTENEAPTFTAKPSKHKI